MARNKAIGQRSRAGPALLVIGLMSGGGIGKAQAFRVAPVEEQAVLAAAAEFRLGSGHCLVPAGTALRILGYPAGPGASAPTPLVALRVMGGACQGYEASLPLDQLKDVAPPPDPAHRPTR